VEGRRVAAAVLTRAGRPLREARPSVYPAAERKPSVAHLHRERQQHRGAAAALRGRGGAAAQGGARRYNVRGLGRVDMSLVEYEEASRGAGAARAPELKAHLYRVGRFRQKFHPFVAPLAADAAILHYTGELKPWRVAAQAARNWRTTGAALTDAGHVVGSCELDAVAARMSKDVYLCPKRAACGDPYLRPSEHRVHGFWLRFIPLENDASGPTLQTRHRTAAFVRPRSGLSTLAGTSRTSRLRRRCSRRGASRASRCARRRAGPRPARRSGTTTCPTARWRSRRAAATSRRTRPNSENLNGSFVFMIQGRL